MAPVCIPASRMGSIAVAVLGDLCPQNPMMISFKRNDESIMS